MIINMGNCKIANMIADPKKVKWRSAGSSDGEPRQKGGDFKIRCASAGSSDGGPLQKGYTVVAIFNTINTNTFLARSLEHYQFFRKFCSQRNPHSADKAWLTAPFTVPPLLVECSTLSRPLSVLICSVFRALESIVVIM